MEQYCSGSFKGRDIKYNIETFRYQMKIKPSTPGFHYYSFNSYCIQIQECCIKTAKILFRQSSRSYTFI